VQELLELLLYRLIQIMTSKGAARGEMLNLNE